MTRVVIIGGGLGGLGTAVRLAGRGCEVTLCEQGTTLGGKMNRMVREGFTFDTGPSLLTLPEVFSETFAAAGEQLEDHVELLRLDPVAEYRYPDGTRLLHSGDLPSWLDTVRALEPRDVEGVLRLLALGGRVQHLSRESFLRRPPTELPDGRVLRALRHLPLRHAWGNYATVVERHLRSPHLRQLFLRYPTYVGSSPWRCPATLLVIPYLENAFGVWYVRGGLYGIVEALAGIARRQGADLRTGASVEHVEQRDGGVRAVLLTDGTRIPADVVVMNGDADDLPALLGTSPGTRLAESERSLSGLVTVAGVSRSLPGLPHHTICFSADYPREFSQLFDEGLFPDDPTVYVNVPSRSDRTLVPGGGEGEALFLMANAPARQDSWDGETLDLARARVWNRLQASGIPDLSSECVVLDSLTPRTMALRYRMPGGAIYGRHSHGWRNAFLRPANRQPTRGLYLVGGSSHPGGGTPTVLLSSRITSGMILRDRQGERG